MNSVEVVSKLCEQVQAQSEIIDALYSELSQHISAEEAEKWGEEIGRIVKEV